MIEDLNRQTLLLLASANLGGLRLLGAYALAQWLIFFVPAALVLLWIFGGRTDRRAAVLAAVTGLLALLLAHGVSTLWFHPRPFMVDPVRNYLNHAPDSSFPSDHATLFFALGFSLLVRRPPLWAWLWIPLMLGGLAVGWARILLGAHYPLDIFGAALIAALSTGIAHSPLGRRACSRLTTTAERIYGIVLPSRNHFAP